MLLGAHVSVAGGLENGPAEGEGIGADVIQLFTRNQRQWDAKPVTDEEAAAFVESRAHHRIGAVMSHASYLLNLAAPSKVARRKSARAFVAEIERCAKLGVTLLNFHPGAHLGSGEAAAIEAAAQILREAIEETPDATAVRLVIENTAGQGSCIGHRFEHLAELLEQVGDPRRTGVCLDTQHAHAAGYEVASAEGFEATLAEFDRRVGRGPLCAFHLNDSKVPFGGKVDRHASLGAGTIGWGLFERLARDPRFAQLPGFLETPAGREGWQQEIAQLRAAAAGERAPVKGRAKAAAAAAAAPASRARSLRAGRAPRADAPRPPRAARPSKRAR